jgi:hypothetical protein
MHLFFMRMTPDDKDNTVSRSTCRQNWYYLQPECTLPAGISYCHNLTQNFNNVIEMLNVPVCNTVYILVILFRNFSNPVSLRGVHMRVYFPKRKMLVKTLHNFLK